MIQNPILPGFCPDPSIIRVEKIIILQIQALNGGLV